MTGWTVMLRGIGFRAGRSLLVLIIAAVATAATVGTAGYLRAAQQSVLTDGLKNAPGYQTDIVVRASGPAGTTPEADDAHLAISQALARLPLLSKAFGKPVAGEDTDAYAQVSGTESGGLAFFAYREDLCAHLIIEGACPTGAGQVLVSKRSAARTGIKIGSRMVVTFGSVQVADAAAVGSKSTHLPVTVAGLYTPRDANEAYWAGNPYFTDGPDPISPTAVRLDAVFTPAESDVRTYPAAGVDLHVEMPLRLGVVRLDQVQELRADISKLQADVASANLSADTGVTVVLDSVAAQQKSLRETVPVVAVPLIVLCLFVLFLVVTALADERTPEFALAKLRGYPAGKAARFGIAEMVTLIVVAMPVGIVLGLILTEVAAHATMASGTGAEVRAPIFYAGVGAMVAGVIAAWLATRNMLRHGVLALLRRVPPRTGWRAGVGVGIAVAFVAASLVGAFMDRSSPIAWLAAPSIALIAGLIAARLMAAASARRLRTAVRRGRIVSLLSGAWLARQPGRSRVVAVLTVAVALLVFGAVGWDVGSAARMNNAVDTLGADRVYTVIAPYPSALQTAVAKADPGGNSMAVVRLRQYYSNNYVELIGLDTTRMSTVAQWRGESASAMSSLATRLRPKSAPQLTVSGTLTLTADVTRVVANSVEIGALVSAPGQPPVAQPLGVLDKNKHTYSVILGGCTAGCRLLGITIGRTVGPSASVSATLTIKSLTAGKTSVSNFSDPALWRVATDRAPQAQVNLTPGTGLGVQLSTTDPSDALIGYQDAPASLPVVVSGGAKSTDPSADTFSFPGLGSDPSSMGVIARTPEIPRGGTDGILFDLGTGVSIAERSGTLADATNLQYEVWADADAPADLGTRLGTQGIAVLATDTMNGYLTALSRGAPTLSMWFYLFAGGLALVLAIGVVLLGAYVGSDSRIYEYASLKVAGVQPKLLRRAVLREYRSVLGTALIVGLAAGIAGALLMLPSIQLVSVGGPTGHVPYSAHMYALYAALIASVVAMAVVVLLAMRVLQRATPDRLREGVR